MREELKNELANLHNEVTSMVSAVQSDVSQTTEILNAISFVMAAPLSLSSGIVEGKSGGSIDVPIYLKEGPEPVSAVQFDVLTDPGITASGAMIGMAAQVANKSIQTVPVQSGIRVIIFGLNQTSIPSGPVAIVQAQIASELGKGKTVVRLLNVSASTPDGGPVGLTTKDGSITVR